MNGCFCFLLWPNVLLEKLTGPSVRVSIAIPFKSKKVSSFLKAPTSEELFTKYFVKKSYYYGIKRYPTFLEYIVVDF